METIQVWGAFETRGEAELVVRPAKCWCRTKEEALKKSEGLGWWGSPGKVMAAQALPAAEGKFWILQEERPVALVKVKLPKPLGKPTAADKALAKLTAADRKALAKLTPEQRRAAGLG